MYRYISQYHAHPNLSLFPLRKKEGENLFENFLETIWEFPNGAFFLTVRGEAFYGFDLRTNENKRVLPRKFAALSRARGSTGNKWSPSERCVTRREDGRTFVSRGRKRIVSRPYGRPSASSRRARHAQVEAGGREKFTISLPKVGRSEIRNRDIAGYHPRALPSLRTTSGAGLAKTYDRRRHIHDVSVNLPLSRAHVGSRHIKPTY